MTLLLSFNDAREFGFQTSQQRLTGLSVVGHFHD